MASRLHSCRRGTRKDAAMTGLILKRAPIGWNQDDFDVIECQTASTFDPRSASNFDPLERRVRAVALAPSELVGVAETARACRKRGSGRGRPTIMKVARQLTATRRRARRQCRR